MKAKFYHGKVCDVSEKGAYWPNTVAINLSWNIRHEHYPFSGNGAREGAGDLPLRFREVNTKRFAVLYNIETPDVDVKCGDYIDFVAFNTEKDGDHLAFGGIYAVNGNITEFGDRFDKKLRAICTVTSNYD